MQSDENLLEKRMKIYNSGSLVNVWFELNNWCEWGL